MDEYIKREYAVDAVLDVYYNTPDIDLSDGKFEAAILKIPVADVAPVRHGRWGNYEPYSDGYRCSCCKLVHRTCTTYCPNCGAKMMEG